MLKKSLFHFWIIPFTLLISQAPLLALPGQTIDEVGAWIRAHPTLSPDVGERFLVQKSDTAAQRFVFQASVFPPGKVEFTKDHSIIRNERIAMYDAINGMTLERLQESLRIIYGMGIYQDFNHAQLVYQYPNQTTMNSDRFAQTPAREALQGELRLGDRYAYWIEVAQPKEGKAFVGQMTVLLRTDLNKIEAELRNR